MAFFSCQNIRISGISACVPSQIENNKDYGWVTGQERDSFIKNTGVLERRIARPGVTASDLCFNAAEKLIEELKWNREEIDALIFVSQSGDYILPATSVILQNRLGLTKNCMSLDIGLGCSGYIYGLSVLSSLMSNGSIKKGLLLVGEKSSSRVSPNDKSTYPLFGDAGTATALEYMNSVMPAWFNLQSDGSGYKSIIITDGFSRNPIKGSSFEYQKIEKGIERRPIDLILNGTEIFDFALRETIPSIKETLSLSGMELESIDYFVLHQANLLINETIRKLMKIPLEKIPYSIQKFGNTSSASIPLTIVSELQATVTKKSLKLVLCGFGVGLSWGTAIVQTDKLVCPGLIEYNG